MNLVIDIGNTVAKLAVFENGEPVYDEITSNTALEALSQVAERFRPEKAVVSAVVELTEEARNRIDALAIPTLFVNGETPTPAKIRYRTPETLGPDRLAAAVGAMTVRPEHNLLIIDAGTCVTYEFVTADGEYLGGNISPGLDMRLKALHEHTARLPLIAQEGQTPVIGYDTETAIRAGVVHGVRLEIEGYIRQYQEKYPELFVFLTGGSCFDFDSRLKNCIFADKYLVPRGLNRILEYNDQSKHNDR